MINCFVVYSRADDDIVQRLIRHLRGLQYAGFIQLWHDQQIPRGEDWKEAIRTKLESADVFCVCMSADLLDSEYVQKVEIPVAMTRRRREQAIVLPIFISNVDVEGHPSGIGELQAFAADSPARNRNKNAREALWTEVTSHLRKICQTRAGVHPDRTMWTRGDRARKDPPKTASSSSRGPEHDNPKLPDVTRDDARRYGFQCHCAVSVLTLRSRIDDEGGEGTFDAAMRTRNDHDERDLEAIMHVFPQETSANSNAAELARQWLYEGHTFDVQLPGLEDCLPSHPGLVLRLAGVWNGWNDFLGLDVEENPEAYRDNEKTDVLEDRAFELYRDAASAISAIVKRAQKQRRLTEAEMFAFLEAVAEAWYDQVQDDGKPPYDREPSDDGPKDDGEP